MGLYPTSIKTDEGIIDYGDWLVDTVADSIELFRYDNITDI